MKNKRILSIIAAGVVTLSVLSGCGKKADTPAVTTTAPAVATTTPAPATTAAVTPAPAASPEVYKASAKDFDKIGWKAEATVTYTDGKITKVEYDEVNKDGKKKSEDEGYAKAMKANSGLTPTIVFAKLTKTALEKDTVDVVTGATGTSASFKTLYEEAKAMKK